MRRLVLYGLGPAAVPFFFVTSGFLLAKHADGQNWWKRELWKRARTLIVPYVIWAALFLLFSAIWYSVHDGKNGISFLSSMARRLGASYWLSALGVDLRTRPQLGVLWYVRNLLLFVGVSPAIVWIVMKFRVVFLAILFPAVLAHACLVKTHEPGLDPAGILIYGFSLEGLLYFSAGILFCIHPVSVREPLRKLLAALGCGILIAFAMDCVHFREISAIVVLSTPFVLAGLWFCIPSGNWPQSLVSCAFPVYLLHVFLNYCVAWTLTRLPGGISAIPGISFCLVAACSLATAFCIRHFAPRLGIILFGGR